MRNYNKYIELYGADMALTMIEFDNATDELLNLLDLQISREILKPRRTTANQQNSNKKFDYFFRNEK